MSRYLTTRKVRAALVAGASVLALVAGTTAALPASAAPEPTKNYVVILDDGEDPEDVAADNGVTPNRTWTEVADGFDATMTPAQAEQLRRDSRVESVREDRVIGRTPPTPNRRALGPSDPSAKRSAPQTAPNHHRPDPRGPRYEIPPQPAQVLTNAPRRVGATASPTASITGGGRDLNVDIAVIDGGVDPYHPDLRVAGGFDCTTNRRDPEWGWYDRDGHGTLVAGFAAARDNKIGVVGVAPGSRIWSIRVFDAEGIATESTMLCGLDWLARHSDTIEVAILSLEEPFDVPEAALPCGRERSKRFPRLPGRVVDPLHAAVCEVVADGVTVVAAAGNAGADASIRRFVAYPEVISVSAIADYDGLAGGLVPIPLDCLPDLPDDQLAYFSNFGRAVDISAPGVCISATFPGGQYATSDGTSFSSPLVAGGAALLMVRHRNWSPERVRKELLRRATPGPIPGDPDSFPEGVLNVQGF